MRLDQSWVHRQRVVMLRQRPLWVQLARSEDLLNRGDDALPGDLIQKAESRKVGWHARRWTRGP